MPQGLALLGLMHQMKLMHPAQTGALILGKLSACFEAWSKIETESLEDQTPSRKYRNSG